MTCAFATHLLATQKLSFCLQRFAVIWGFATKHAYNRYYKCNMMYIEWVHKYLLILYQWEWTHVLRSFLPSRGEHLVLFGQVSTFMLALGWSCLGLRAKNLINCKACPKLKILSFFVLSSWYLTSLSFLIL